MKPINSYILNAGFNWIADSGCTPYIVVNAELDNVSVPQQYVKDGMIILNISPTAVPDLVIDNNHVSFSARFNGKIEHIYVPMNAIQTIYSRETGAGMPLPPMEAVDVTETKTDKSKKEDKKNPFTVVK